VSDDDDDEEEGMGKSKHRREELLKQLKWHFIPASRTLLQYFLQFF